MKSPHEISEDRIKLAEEYSRYSGDLAELIKLQAEHFNENRDYHKSDTATKRDWERTENGVKMTIIKLKLKSIEKTMSALNTHLRLLENQAKNLY